MLLDLDNLRYINRLRFEEIAELKCDYITIKRFLLMYSDNVLTFITHIIVFLNLLFFIDVNLTL
jgi:hypothetical protein